MRINLTLPGTGGSSVIGGAAASSVGGLYAGAGRPPAAAPPAPPQVVAKKKVVDLGQKRMGAENIRNKGGGRGLDVMGTTQRALKSLTGQ